MAKFRINIFFVISLVCLLILIGYLWIIFLPSFERSINYEAVKVIVTIVTILLSISGILIFLLMRVEE